MLDFDVFVVGYCQPSITIRFGQVYIKHEPPQVFSPELHVAIGTIQ